jgi:hypothetical protein
MAKRKLSVPDKKTGKANASTHKRVRRKPNEVSEPLASPTSASADTAVKLEIIAQRSASPLQAALLLDARDEEITRLEGRRADVTSRMAILRAGEVLPLPKEELTTDPEVPTTHREFLLQEMVCYTSSLLLL